MSNGMLGQGEYKNEDIIFSTYGIKIHKIISQKIILDVQLFFKMLTIKRKSSRFYQQFNLRLY